MTKRNLTPLMKKYEKSTEKKAKWGGKLTKGYKKWRRKRAKEKKYSMKELVSKTLREDERLVSEGELLKNKIMELTHKQDEELIDLLLSNDRIKEHFFTEVDGTLVFDKDEFIKFVNNKKFLPDSYTTFKNKIGLKEGGEYLDRKKDIALAWPYKDCVLEGDQTDPEKDRDEIFWNETLAPDEVDRLLNPKVLTNFKRINEEGKHKNPELNPDDNLVIQGNNLLILHTLKKKYPGKIKLIYIDPPYNRERDNFNYNNNFNHSTYLTFLKNRLKAAKSLLSEDGAIIVSCDDNEQAYLKVLMDEIFDKSNFLLNGVVNRPSEIASNFTVSKHEYFIVYSKNIDEFSLGQKERHTLSRGTVGNEDQTMPVITFPAGLKCVDVDDGIYEETRKIEGSRENIENLDDIVVEDGKLAEDVRLKARWRSSNDMRNFFENDCSPTEAKINGVIEEIYLKGDRFMPQIKKRITTKIPSLITDNKRGSKDLEELNLPEDFDYPKNAEYIQKLISYFVSDGDIVLDFFAGSGTTSHAVWKLRQKENINCKFIICEQLDFVDSLIIPRLKKLINEGLGTNFVYFELAKWNKNYLNKIDKTDTESELLQIWEEMTEEAFLSYEVDIEKFDENVDKFQELGLENQKKFLIECLDKNHLYVNLSEIDDEEYDISEEDKKMNKQFYGGV